MGWRSPLHYAIPSFRAPGKGTWEGCVMFNHVAQDAGLARGGMSRFESGSPARPLGGR